MGNYDHDALGTGNPNHPANRKEVPQFQSDDLQECLDYYFETQNIVPLINAVEVNKNKLDKAVRDIQEIVDICVASEIDLLKNKLITVRKNLE